MALIRLSRDPTEGRLISYFHGLAEQRLPYQDNFDIEHNRENETQMSHENGKSTMPRKGRFLAITLGSLLIASASPASAQWGGYGEMGHGFGYSGYGYGNCGFGQCGYETNIDAPVDGGASAASRGASHRYSNTGSSQSRGLKAAEIKRRASHDFRFPKKEILL